MDLYILLRGIVRSVLIVFNNLYVLLAHFIWLLLLQPVWYIGPDLYWWIEGILFHWLHTMVSAWPWSVGYAVQEQGDDISHVTSSECLMLVNHQSTADVPIMMSCLVSKPSVINNVMWMMDYVFKYTNFGVHSLFHGDFFILQGKKHRQGQLEELRQHLRNIYVPRDRKWIVLFPEGGFLRKRLANSHIFAKKNDLPMLKHVTLPRIGAMQTVLETLNPKNGCIHDTQPQKNIKWIIDVTIGYEGGKPLDLQTVMFAHRAPMKTVLYYKVYPASVVPCDSDSLTAWLYGLYVEKERMLEKFYATGQFPTPATNTENVPIIKEPRVIEVDYVKVVSVRLFFLISLVIQCIVLKAILF